ncbi:hypothetical protein BGZ61DRAFT_127064 [Ilyonectria robusta]|uniref:uncharacterized protein n=1 Tax=Ilyonectria robusta TaxID=1079257 RepID=UPI001E8E09C4|nr:uncharacterized protein BGZ61DRAFT_127064 [Ilyonectria robusta]KAH8734617.1 hypothetical protein BGZ61DRAFT_127064 [Ilyonectria robusta]
MTCGRGLVRAWSGPVSWIRPVCIDLSVMMPHRNSAAAPQHRNIRARPGSHGAYRPTASTHTHYEDGVTRWSTPAGALCCGWTHRTFQRSIPCVHPNPRATHRGIPLFASPTIGMAEREPALIDGLPAGRLSPLAAPACRRHPTAATRPRAESSPWPAPDLPCRSVQAGVRESKRRNLL